MPSTADVDLIIPVKPLSRAKSRLLGAADGGRCGRSAHVRLVLALLEDTVTAALCTDAVRRVVVATPDTAVAQLALRLGADVVQDEPPDGLNAALRQAARVLRRDDPRSVVGALQGDLPALRPDELSQAIFAAEGRRAYCADRHGSGTTLLLSAQGGDLVPRFGRASADAHRLTGALALSGCWPSLTCDVDTAADLRAAAALGLATATRSVVDGVQPSARSAAT
ncbi:MAG: 2-phospho-L-lactate guanylyltransferase [Actinomycetota bacterium]|nr:2-phospho-L-lactate guanylyltransferase [Actinomycetota bacterium]